MERCILNSQFYVDTNTVSAYPTTYFEEEETSCSSNKNVGGSFYSDWITKKDNEETYTWSECKLASPEPFYARGAYTTRLSDVEAMKEKFSKLLLGDDVTGGRKGKTSALAISNAIINLTASAYGEFWKLEPLAEEGKAKWIKEMNCLVSPANYMVELVPAEQSGTNGCIFEIMTPKARTDVQINIPALACLLKC